VYGSGSVSVSGSLTAVDSRRQWNQSVGVCQPSHRLGAEPSICSGAQPGWIMRTAGQGLAITGLCVIYPDDTGSGENISSLTDVYSAALS